MTDESSAGEDDYIHSDHENFPGEDLETEDILSYVSPISPAR